MSEEDRIQHEMDYLPTELQLVPDCASLGHHFTLDSQRIHNDWLKFTWFAIRCEEWRHSGRRLSVKNRIQRRVFEGSLY